MSDINITNNFNAPIGQHIDHVDTVNLQMDGDGQFHFGMVETSYENENTEQARADESSLSVCRAEGVSTEGQNQNINNNERRSNDELFHFIHPAMDEDQERKIHNEVKRLVKRQGVQMICQHLLQMKEDEKLLLPPNPSVVYNELVRMGMPQNGGYNENTFRKYYSNR